MPLSRNIKTAFAVLGILLLAACAHKEEQVIVCPDTGLTHDADIISVFKGAPAAPQKTDVEASSAFGVYRGNCIPLKDKPGWLEFDLEIDVGARKGPAADPKLSEETFPYFVAVLSPDEQILQREAFTTTVSFNDKGTGLTTEKQKILIPISDPKLAPQYKVAIGYVLTPEQLAFNRGESPKPPVAAEAPQPAPAPVKKTKKKTHKPAAKKTAVVKPKPKPAPAADTATDAAPATDTPATPAAPSSGSTTFMTPDGPIVVPNSQ